ncbi:MAG: cob(I)yrinic acid a,c-diamide adenosyltransferase [Bacteroidetes bacterium]|nr:cob(I)yrinic acid a,c-diamide adenosyltransferase [Bacteroidota bacterium]
MRDIVKIYTKTGDQGKTALFGGRRVGKDSARIEAYGTIDELNAFLGFALVSASTEVADLIVAVQNELFVFGADLATPLETRNTDITRIDEKYVARIEQRIDMLEEQLQPIRYFIIPGGGETAARLHMCRTIARRAERLIVNLSAMEEINEADLRYINRLSDFLFVLARYANYVDGFEDVRWQQE